MSSSQYTIIIEKLIKRTRENAVAWAETGNPNEFAAVFAEFSLAMKYISENARRDTILFSIRSKQAKVIDQFSVGADLGATWDEVVELYFAARRRALSIDDAINTIITALDEETPGIPSSKDVIATAEAPVEHVPTPNPPVERAFDEDARGPSATLPLRHRIRTEKLPRSA